MRFSLTASILSALTFISCVSATITAFSAPNTTLTQGKTFNVTFTTAASLTNNEQYYALFALSDMGDLYPRTIGGEPFANVNLLPIQKDRFSFQIPITLNEDIVDSEQQFNLATAVFGQVGASGGITLQYFNQTITVAP